MAERKEIVVQAVPRNARGKNDARRLRAEGKVPVVVYGGDGEPVSAAAPLNELAAILRSDTGPNTIFTLDVEGVGASEVLFQDRQIDPIRGRLVHADLRRLVRGQELEVTVPLHLNGEPYGVKHEAGVLEHTVRELDIRCRPRDIPEAINIDVSGMHVQDVLHVSDLAVGEGVTILADPGMVIATVGVIRAQVAETETPEEEITEPEVIGKGGEEEEGTE